MRDTATLAGEDARLEADVLKERSHEIANTQCVSQTVQQTCRSDRVQLESGGIRVSLNLKRLIAEPIDSGDPAGLTMTRFIPIEMKRRGVEIRLVIEGEAARAARPDPAMKIGSIGQFPGV